MFGKLIDYKILNSHSIQIHFENKDGIINIIDDCIVQFKEISTSAFAIKNDNLYSNVHFDISKENNLIKIIIKNYTYIIKDDFLIDIYKDNILISSQCKKELKKKELINKELVSQEGHNVDEEDEYSFNIQKLINKDDYIYGLGEKTGFLSKRGYEYEMYNTDNPAPQVDCFKALYKSIPFMIIFNPKYTYGFFFDNTYKQHYDLCKSEDNLIQISFLKGYYNYYFIGGNTLKDVVENYTLITGRMDLPQRWTLGYQQCRWSYMNKDELMFVARKFREEHIPCDTLFLDIDYMDHYKVFTTSNDRFPNFKEMVDELTKMNYKLVTIIDPGVKKEEGYLIYDQLIKNHMVATLNNEIYYNEVWPGISVYPSFIDEKVQKFWGEQINFLLSLGVRGIWNDMNEPASFKGPLPDNVEFKSNDTIHYHDEVHNVYAHYMAKATYEGLKKYDKRRPYIITRAAYSGTQKYSTIWTGDNHSIYAHLQMMIPMLLNLGLSGFSFAGSDIGGFSSDCTKELMIRWVEAGTFVPLFRNHSAMNTARQEPWAFDEETISIYRKFVSLRYKYIPYLYDLFFEAANTGIPVLRPLVMEFSQDKDTYEINDQYMVGSSLLVSPIVEQGKRKKLVYLPEGNWYEESTNKEYHHGYHIIDAPLDTLPLFVKEGSIIPSYLPHEYINDDEEVLILNIYPGSGNYVHYQDNGSDYKYEDGEYNMYEIVHMDNQIRINLAYSNYKPYKKIILRYLNKELEIYNYDNQVYEI